MKNLTPFVARVFLSLIFLFAAIRNLINPDAVMANMAAHGMRFTLFFLIAAMVVQFAGSLSLIFGYKARIGAGLLILFLIPSTLIFHLDFSEPQQNIQFLKNLGLIGGLMLIMQYVPGAISFDRKV